MTLKSVVEPPALTDPDDAYANAPHIAAADAIVARWPMRAQAFRDRLDAEGRFHAGRRYGEGPGERADIFYPEGHGCGVAVFVHGGYWMRFSPEDFSHLAAGAVARGWVVVLPGYPLCPGVSIDTISDCIRRAVIAASELADGPVRLAGHSAGGHLVTRLLCRDTVLPGALETRLERTLSISGIHDLVPLLATSMNDTLKLDLADALAGSPARHLPRPGVRACAWVGSNERPEFIRQNALLGNIWNGLGVRVATHVETGRHHFDVIEDLVRTDSPMLEWWLGSG